MALDNNTVLNYTDKTTIKNWFKTGLKPTQTQFWSTWDSFWHKSESLPISSINGLGGLLDGKAEENHTHSEYATNDATSLTPANVISWQQALGVDDLDYVEIPTENAAENSHPYVVVIDDEGKSAKRNATDFGKVDTIDGIEADENKNIALGAVRKSESNTVNDDFSMQQENGAFVSIASNGLKVGFGGITATYGTSSISVDNIVPDAAYKFQELLFPKRAVKNIEEKVYPVTYVQGVKADETGRVDISGISWNYTSSNIRYSGLVDKSADATFNQFALFDSNGNLAKATNAYNAFYNSVIKMSPSERINILKAFNSQYSTGQITTSLILKPIIEKTTNDGYTIVRIIGTNLLIDPDTSYVNIKDKNNTVIFSSCKFINSTSEELLVYVPNSFIEVNKEYVFDIKHGIQLHTTFEYLSVVDVLNEYDLNNINFKLTNHAENITTPILNTTIDNENKKIINTQILAIECTDARFYRYFQKVKTNQFASSSDNFIVELNIDWGYGTSPWDVYQKIFDIISLSKYKNITDVNDMSDNTITGIKTGYKGNNNGGDETWIINGNNLYLSGLFTLTIIKQDTRFTTILEHQSGQVLYKKQTAVITEGFNLEFLFPTRSLPVTIGKYSINSIQLF